MSSEPSPVGVAPIRSLCMVGPDEAKIEAAVAAACDAIWLDLEEPQWPYPIAAQRRARELYAEFIESRNGAGGPKIFVRVSHPKLGETMADLRAVVGPNLTGIIAPKSDTPADIHQLDGLLLSAETERGLEPGSLQVLPLLESAGAVRLAYEIAVSSPRVTYMYSGLSKFGDVARELGYEWTPQGDETFFMRSKVLLDARAAGIRYPIGAAWRGPLEDTEGFERWAWAQRELGYFGMNTRPAEVERAHEIFSPTPDQIAYWVALLDAVAKAEAEGIVDLSFPGPDGVVGPMREAFVETARWNLQWAEQLGLHPAAGN